MNSGVYLTFYKIFWLPELQYTKTDQNNTDDKRDILLTYPLPPSGAVPDR